MWPGDEMSVFVHHNIWLRIHISTQKTANAFAVMPQKTVENNNKVAANYRRRAENGLK